MISTIFKSISAKFWADKSSKCMIRFRNLCSSSSSFATSIRHQKHDHDLKLMPNNNNNQAIRLNEILSNSKQILSSESSSSLSAKQNDQPNLQNLIAEEVMIITHILKKLVGTNYSLAEIQKLYENESSSDHFMRGLIVLLISKAAESSATNNASTSSDISKIQWRLAKIIEMIHMAVVIHQRIRNVQFETLDSGSIETQVNLSNKISVLYGDFLWAKAWKELADMNDLEVIDMMVSVLLNNSIGQFLSEIESIDLHSKMNIDYWTKKNFLQNACLTAFGCRSTLKLVGINEQLQSEAYDFGKNFGFFNQAYREIEWFNAGNDAQESIDDYPLNICSLPIIMEMNNSNNNQQTSNIRSLIDRIIKRNTLKLYKYKQRNQNDDDEFDNEQQELIENIRNGSSIQQSLQILNEFREKSLKNLSKFPESIAKLQLKIILETMEPIIV